MPDIVLNPIKLGGGGCPYPAKTGAPVKNQREEIFSDNFCKFLNVYLRYVKNHFPW